MRKFISLLILFLNFGAIAQAIPDKSFAIRIMDPLYEKGTGPTVAIDQAHNNFHTKTTGLFAISDMLESDGFLVIENDQPFSVATLEKVDILVIVNPLHDSNNQNWTLPCPSAFTAEEIEVLQNWVAGGGRLLLSADHMPYGGAVQDLAKKFGVTWSNSFAIGKNRNQWPPSEFIRTNKTLLSSPVTDSSATIGRIDFIASFTGSAFKAPDAIPFLKFDSSHEILQPEIAWRFDRKTKKGNAKGWLQGACLEFGSGKLVLLGEAAMISAQIRGRTKIGMNSPDAPENSQLAINIFHYLTK